MICSTPRGQLLPHIAPAAKLSNAKHLTSYEKWAVTSQVFISAPLRPPLMVLARPFWMQGLVVVFENPEYSETEEEVSVSNLVYNEYPNPTPSEVIPIQRVPSGPAVIYKEPTQTMQRPLLRAHSRS